MSETLFRMMSFAGRSTSPDLGSIRHIFKSAANAFRKPGG